MPAWRLHATKSYTQNNMNNDTIKKHTEMVLRLAKPGQKILETLTAADCDLIHMGGCFSGEGSELYEALRLGEDPIEELGDFQFYWCKVADIFHLERSEYAPNSQDDPLLAATRLMVLAGEFWDVTKRATVYRKPVETEKAIDILQKMEQQLYFLQGEFNFSLEEVLEANYKKLADKDTGRYREGQYSDQAAQSRRDKSER